MLSIACSFVLCNSLILPEFLHNTARYLSSIVYSYLHSLPMYFHQKLPKKADIVILSKKNTPFRAYYKPLKAVQKFGIILGGAVLLFGATLLFLTQQQGNTLLTASHTQAEMANNGLMPWGDPGNDNWKAYRHTYNKQTTTSVPAPITPFPQYPATSPSPNYPSTNFAVNTMPFIPVQQQFPATPVAIVSPEPAINQPNTQNIGGISSQIIATQQQIAGQMQSCISTARQMANQIITLKDQQKQLQSQMDTLNNQYMNVDGNTQTGQQQQDAINQRLQQLQTQMDNLGNTISNAQDNLNNTSNQCQQNVSQLEQHRGDLESSLDDAFNNTMAIQIPD